VVSDLALANGRRHIIAAATRTYRATQAAGWAAKSWDYTNFAGSTAVDPINQHNGG